MTYAPTRTPRFWSLDALRGLCALIVFLSHWILWADFPTEGAVEDRLRNLLHGATDWFAILAWPLGANHPAVICFFVLSGFCIHQAFVPDAQAGRRDIPWRQFYGRRFVRIMPVYWTAALLGLVLVSAEIVRPSGSPLLALHTESSLVRIFVRLAGATDLYPFEILAGNGPLNTVGVELLLYLAYPLFFRGISRHGWLAVGLFFVALEVAGLLLLPVLSPFWIYNSILMYGVFWYAGAFTAHVYAQHGTRSYVRELLVCWAAFVALNGMPHFYGFSVLKQNLWGVICVLGVLQCLHFESRGPGIRGRASRWLQYSGIVSYSLYAVHTPALLLGTWAMIALGIQRYSTQLIVTMAAAIAATLIVHYGIERVFYRPRIRPVAPAVVHDEAASPMT